MQYTKPALTFEAQAEKLIKRGMGGDRALMIERLQAVGYYRLSGYWHSFRKKDGQGVILDDFRDDTSFDDVWDRYVFDRRLRLIVMDAVERIEVFMRGQLSYCHSHAHGPFAYAVDRTSLPKPNDEYYAEYIECLTRETAQSKDTFAEHFRAKYGDCHAFLPIWMATEVMNFGTIKTIYDGATNQVKQAISTSFGLPPKVLSSWLLTLNSIRNICAHHKRLWNKELGVKASIPKQKDYPDWHTPFSVTSNRVFGVLTFCRYSLKRIAPQSEWVCRLIQLLHEHRRIPLADMGFLDGWESNPIWAIPGRWSWRRLLRAWK